MRYPSDGRLQYPLTGFYVENHSDTWTYLSWDEDTSADTGLLVQDYARNDYPDYVVRKFLSFYSTASTATVHVVGYTWARQPLMLQLDDVEPWAPLLSTTPLVSDPDFHQGQPRKY